MKLYLSSYRIPTPERLWKLIGKQPSDIRVAIIPNAKDYKPAREYQLKKQELISYMNDLGLHPAWHDLRKFTQKDTLRDTLAGYDLLYVAGGNSFCLRHAMKHSGFDEMIEDLLKSGVTYFGESAGAVVAGTSLRGIELADDPGQAEVVYFDGLKLVPKMIIPHADNLEFAAAMSPLLDPYSPKSRIVLNDNQAFIVSGNGSHIITATI